ncbi:glutamine synthetase family protein [Pseudooceanicola sp. CBS1P-1]|uniref:Glutamine synthetase n=1 Tax=Pseudooceanicola albus TaxID=2692189 RepID=A0A6L7G1X5_9RHOB|nr:MULTISPECIES: glutamine synthetase family protein [Pseudooceanicola]MBT9383592.1 glutamine synthetase family protein [Pseudooceanicola endophyticus]MXN17447.1 glutamine synthetase [Pseudooceanicola albus]
MVAFETSKDPLAADAYVVAAVCDLNGIYRGKRIPAAQAAKIETAGIRMPMSSVGVDIWGSDAVGSGLTLSQGDTDGVCLPIGRGALPVLGDRDRARLVPMWMQTEDGQPFYSDARQVLARVLAQYAARGLTPVVATELEFHLTDPAGPGIAPADLAAGLPPGRFDNIYSVQEIDGAAALFDEVQELAARCGIEPESLIAEGGPRQYEITLRYRDDALRIADDTLLLKQILRSVAARHGHAACFMAKPYAERSGNGLHVHVSVLDAAGRNIFDDGGPEGTPVLRQAIAGLVGSMRDLGLVFAPHQNSFRRLAPGTLAPTTAAWGYENRTSAIRVPGGPALARRFEHRVAGADANPYLVLAAILAGALDGIERALEAPAPVSGNSYDAEAPALDPDWRAAIERFAGSALAARLLHPDFVHYFTACKRQELAGFDAHIPAFEIATYRASV